MQPCTVKSNLPHLTFVPEHHLLSPAILPRALPFPIRIPEPFGDSPSSVPSVSGHCLIPTCLMLWVLAGFLGLGAVPWWKASCQGGNVSGQWEAESAPSAGRNKATFLGFYRSIDPPRLLHPARIFSWSSPHSLLNPNPLVRAEANPIRSRAEYKCPESAVFLAREAFAVILHKSVLLGGKSCWRYGTWHY